MRAGFFTLVAGAAAAVVGLTAQSCGLSTLGLLVIALGATLLTRQARGEGDTQ